MTTVSRANDPRSVWSPEDYDFKAWGFDVTNAANSATMVDGTMFVVRLRIHEKMSISNVHFVVSGSGSTLANAFAALYQDGALLRQSANQNTAFESIGGKTIPLTATDVEAGFLDVGFWATGTGMPNLGRAGQLSGIADFLTGQDERFATADAGLTDTAPATLGAKTGSSLAVWCAVS